MSTKAKTASKAKRKEKKNITTGIVNVLSTFNNTIISVTDEQGNLVVSSSSGAMGFKGSRKSTPFAAQIAAEDAANKAKARGMDRVEIRVKGPGSGRESALRAVQAAGLTVTAIRDMTGVPHNGCRPPKARRV